MRVTPYLGKLLNSLSLNSFSCMKTVQSVACVFVVTSSVNLHLAEYALSVHINLKHCLSLVS